MQKIRTDEIPIYLYSLSLAEDELATKAHNAWVNAEIAVDVLPEVNAEQRTAAVRTAHAALKAKEAYAEASEAIERARVLATRASECHQEYREQRAVRDHLTAQTRVVEQDDEEYGQGQAM
jgi:hypothetical protein